MQEQEKPKKQIIRIEVHGSETIIEKIRRKTPWIFGTKLRKPKIIFPKLRFKRVNLPLPPRSLNILIIFITLFILQTGIIYLILRDPPALGADSEGDPAFIWLWTVYEAYIIESIVAAILMFIASIGFVFLYHSSKYIYDKKMADWIMVIAILLIAIAFILLQIMLKSKIRPKTFNSS